MQVFKFSAEWSTHRSFCRKVPEIFNQIWRPVAEHPRHRLQPGGELGFNWVPSWLIFAFELNRLKWLGLQEKRWKNGAFCFPVSQVTWTTVSASRKFYFQIREPDVQLHTFRWVAKRKKFVLNDNWLWLALNRTEVGNWKTKQEERMHRTQFLATRQWFEKLAEVTRKFIASLNDSFWANKLLRGPPHVMSHVSSRFETLCRIICANGR